MKTFINYCFGLTLAFVDKPSSMHCKSTKFINFLGVPLVELKFGLLFQPLKDGIRLYAVNVSTGYMSCQTFCCSVVLVTKMS